MTFVILTVHCEIHHLLAIDQSIRNQIGMVWVTWWLWCVVEHTLFRPLGREVVAVEVRQAQGLLGIGSAVNAAVLAAEKPRPAKQGW